MEGSGSWRVRGQGAEVKWGMGDCEVAGCGGRQKQLEEANGFFGVFWFFFICDGSLSSCGKRWKYESVCVWVGGRKGASADEWS